MDISCDLSDLINDESFTKILRELDDPNLLKNLDDSAIKVHSVIQKSNTPSRPEDFNPRSTSNVSEPSSIPPPDNLNHIRRDLWLNFENDTNLIVNTSLRPVIRHLLDTVIRIDGKDVSFSKKRSYLEVLIEGIVTEYKDIWKDVYIPAGHKFIINSTRDPSDDSFDSKILNRFKDITERLNCVCLYKELTKQQSRRIKIDFNFEGNKSSNILNRNYGWDFIELMNKRSIMYFYHLLDYLFNLLEKSKYGFKVVYTLDIIYTLVKVLPELALLLTTPRNRESRILSERRSYIKRLFSIIKRSLDANLNMNIQTIYKCGFRGTYRPSYITLDGVNADGFMEVIHKMSVMYRIISLVRLILKTFAGLDEQLLLTFKKVLKKNLIVPFLSIKCFHELFIPVSGKIRVNLEHVDVDYISILKMYLYPPPPLHLIRLKFLELLYDFMLFIDIEYQGYYNKINNLLCTNDPITGDGKRVDTVLRCFISLFIYGSSYFLFPEFVKNAMEFPFIFYGTYFMKMPHYMINSCKLNNTGLEESIYKLQERVLRLLRNYDTKLLIQDNFLNLKTIGLIQNSIIKRILMLTWHYITASRNDDEKGVEVDSRSGKCCRDSYLSIQRGSKNNENCTSPSCNKIVPYDIYSIILYMKDMEMKPLKFNIGPLKRQAYTVTFMTSEQISELVKFNPTIDYNTKDTKTLEFGTLVYTPKRKPAFNTDRCTLECLVYKHMIKNCRSMEYLKTLRKNVLLLSLDILISIKTNEPFNDLSPIYISILHKLNRQYTNIIDA